ncbi:MAG: FG-GAP-like repeat-containing protein [Candidatus Marinimicrobia bacterium]|nr:FG-GAP-like repeat-containing protein [Candidatus Neomarinimicrobiota bacterium]MCF7839945.1 FG-GAP-like repeat-containing protein [Candidatus Neomarinimicrobiota bacterium]
MGIVKLLKNSLAIVIGSLLVYSAMSVWSGETQAPGDATIVLDNPTPQSEPQLSSLKAPSDPINQVKTFPLAPTTAGTYHVISRELVRGREFKVISRIVPESGIPGTNVTITCPEVLPDQDVQVFLNSEPVGVEALEAGQVSIQLPDRIYGHVHVEIVTDNVYYQRLSGLNILRPKQSSPYFAHPEIISRTTERLDILWSIDMDLDGDVDILTASSENGYFAWLENLNGQGNFGLPNVVTPGTDSLITAGVVDLDADGDMDIYAIFASNSRFVWFENVTGMGRFSAPITIPAIREPLRWAECADLDGDGDVDILTAAGTQTGVLSWYENIGGRGKFSSEHIITRSPRPFQWVSAGDLNRNGYLDVLAACVDQHEIAWYVNVNGKCSFSSPQVITNLVEGVAAAVTADMDGDQNMDVISVSSGDSKIAWYRNRDGRGVFGNQVTISTTATGARAVSVADLDADGDPDVLTSSYSDGRILWFENAGEGEFNTEHTVTDVDATARFAQATDVDSDGDLDILAVSFTGDEILLFRQLSAFVGNNVRTAIPRAFRLHQNYPNPFNPQTTIRYSLPEASNVELVVMNAVGQEVNTLVQRYEQASFKSVVWDGRDGNGKSLGSGVYFYRIKAGHYQESKKMILIR